MDFVKREDQNVIEEESYKVYMDSLQKSHQIDTSDYQHTPISMEQLHQAMQSTIVHNFQLPLSPRQMSTLMLKTNHLSRNLHFNEIPAHLPRNLTMEIDLAHNLASDMPHNLRNEDILSQNLSRNIDISLVRASGNELELQNGLAQMLVQNMEQDLRINDVNIPQNLRTDLPHDLSHEMDLSHHLSRQNIEQDLLNQAESRRTPMVVQCIPENHVLDHRLEQNLAQRLEQSIAQRLDQNLGQRLDQNIIQRLDQNLAQRLEQNLAQRLEQNITQRLDQNLVHRLDQNITQRLDQNLAQRLEQNMGQRLDQRLVNSNLIHERLEENEHLLPMPFHIKSEQEDDGYFYENINQGINNPNGLNGHIQPEHTQAAQTNIHTDTQIYSVYSSHVQNIPALNPIELYSRPNYPQNYGNVRDNPQNLVVHRQFENSSPYQEEFKKLRQDDVENGEKIDSSISEKPKENLKPTDQNKLFFTEYNQGFSNDSEKNENDSGVHNKLTEELSVNIKGEYTCYKCNDVFPSKRGLKQHAKACVENGEENTLEKVGKFGCTQCAYRCQSPAILKIHERTHSGEKPFSCTFCDYKSGQKNNVAKHILVHMKEKPFRCQYCEYRCAQKNNLVVHERTHTGYKPFGCPYCDYRTVQKPNLVKHMYLHTDQKPFGCDMCSYRCVQKTNLTKHKQRHLNEKEGDKVEVKSQIKPYRPRQKSVKCPHCPYRCVQKASMEKHMQFKHNGQEFPHESFEQGLNLMKNDENHETIQNLSVKKDEIYTEGCQDKMEPLQIQS